MSFRLAGAQSQSIPRTVERALAAGYAEEKGALLLINGSGQYAPCGADPALIAAVAESGGGADTSGFNILGRKEFPSGFMQAISVDEHLTFRAKYIGALPAADGAAYGVIRDSDGIWKVDFNDTVATRLKLVGRLTDSPENVPEVLVQFLPANIQAN